MDDACITRDARREEMLETDEVNVAEHDFAFGLPHEQASLSGSVLLEESLCSLLKLLRADLFGSHPLWNDE